MPAYRDDLAAAHQRIAELEEQIASLRGELSVPAAVRVKRAELGSARMDARDRLRHERARARRWPLIVGAVLSIPVLGFVSWLVSLGHSGHPFNGFIFSFPGVVFGYLIARAVMAPRVRAAEQAALQIEHQIELLDADARPRGRVRIGAEAASAEEEEQEAEEEAAARAQATSRR